MNESKAHNPELLTISEILQSLSLSLSVFFAEIFFSVCYNVFIFLTLVYTNSTFVITYTHISAKWTSWIS